MKSSFFCIEFTKSDKDGHKQIFVRADTIREALIMAIAERIEAGENETLSASHVYKGEDSGTIFFVEPSLDNDWKNVPLPTFINLELGYALSPKN